jgi:transposase
MSQLPHAHPKETRDAFREAYEETGSVPRATEIVGIPISTGYDWARQMDLERRDYSLYTIKQRKGVIEGYADCPHIPTLAKRNDVSVRAARRWLKEEGVYDVERSHNWRAKHLQKTDAKKRACRIYKLGFSIADTSDIVDEPQGSVAQWVKEEGISRPSGEGVRLAKREAMIERALRVCRYKADHPDATWKEIGEAVGLHPQTCSKHWRGPHNPYRSGKNGRKVA